MHLMRITIGLVLLTTLSAACQLPARRPPTEREAVKETLVWPRPPLRARVRFLKALGGRADLGIELSFWQQVGGVLVGKEEQWFIRPTGLAVDEERIYVADPGARSLWILDPQAGHLQKIQKAGGQRLISPVAVTHNQSSHILLADSYLGKVFVFTTNGEMKGTIGDADLRRPAGLAYDVKRNRLYVADSLAHRVWIFTGDGKRIGAIGHRGTGNGEFNFPTHLAVDRKGNLYVTDALGFRVQVFDLEGKFIRQFGRHGDSSGDFASPKGVALDSEGHIYVVDALFDAVQIFGTKGTYLLTFGQRGIGLGQFWLPGGIFIDASDRIYVADAYNQRIQIFQYLKGGFNG
ncbi:MAG: 6-bladed beta-propeller [Candidatus Binatia bacterium]